MRFNHTNQKGFANIILVVVIVILVGAVGYFAFVKKSEPIAQQTPTPTPTSNTRVPTPTPTPTLKSRIYENQYMKVTISGDWKLTEATRTIQNQSYDKTTGKTTLIGTPIVEKTGAVNIIKGNYILYINTQASQTSGIAGGRFGEIAGGAPSADAVVIDPSGGGQCGVSETHPAFAEHPRVDLYIGSQDNQDRPWCAVPSNGKTVWYFSYITNSNNSYFNYYKEGEARGYVITMAYNSKIVNNFPVKGSTTLNSMLNEMTTIVKSLEIKQK